MNTTIALPVLLIATALSVICYWVDFFTRGGVHVKKDDWYMKFEGFTNLWTIGLGITLIVCLWSSVAAV